MDQLANCHTAVAQGTIMGYDIYIERNQPIMTTITPITNLTQIVEHAQETVELVHELLPGYKKLQAFRNVVLFTLAEELTNVGETKAGQAVMSLFTEVLYENQTCTGEMIDKAEGIFNNVLKVWNTQTNNNKLMELLLLCHLITETQEVMLARLNTAKAAGHPKAHGLSAAFRVEANLVVSIIGYAQDDILA